MPNYWPWINPFEQSTSEIPLLREAFADWKIVDGIFGALSTLGEEMPWDDHAEAETLDIEYFGNHSGGKFVAPVVMNLLGDTESLLDADRIVLAKIIWTKFGEPWKHLWETNVVVYNPIHNYNMSETRHLERDDTGTQDDSTSSVDTITHGRTNEVTDFTYGMNNADELGKRSSRTTSQEGGTTSTSGTGSLDRDTTDNRVEDETITRAGNIGVTTTQQMLTADRELWLWNYFDQVYKDIDSVLALPFYDPCRI